MIVCVPLFVRDRNQGGSGVVLAHGWYTAASRRATRHTMTGTTRVTL